MGFFPGAQRGFFTTCMVRPGWGATGNSGSKEKFFSKFCFFLPNKIFFLKFFLKSFFTRFCYFLLGFATFY